MTKSTAKTAYIPGVCNINYAEIAQRRRLGHFGVVAFVLLLAGLVAFDVTRYDRIVVFLPAFLAASGYLQARNHFCTGYAAAGKQNATEGSTEASTIADKAARAADRKRALRINLQAAGMAAIVTAAALAVPHI